MLLSEHLFLYGAVTNRVSDPDPVGSGVFAWIRIRIGFSNFSGSGSGFSPDSGTKKNAERPLKVIYQRKLKIYDKGPSKNEKGNNFLLKLIIK